MIMVMVKGPQLWQSGQCQFSPFFVFGDSSILSGVMMLSFLSCFQLLSCSIRVIRHQYVDMTPHPSPYNQPSSAKETCRPSPITI